MASAVVICFLGLAAIILGGVAFTLFACAWSLVMTFELAALSSPGYPLYRRYALSAVAAAACAVCIALIADRAIELPFVVVVMLCCVAMLPKGQAKFFSFGIAVVLAASAISDLRQFNGVISTIWFVSVVAASDISGYFCGKIFQGPRIAPRISPGKRWSGAVAGLAFASIIGFGFSGSLGLWVAWASPFLAIAAQAGDIAESWLKRQVGVKDSSSAIPGHGGFFDRFDSYVGAGILLWLFGLSGLAEINPA